METKMHKNLSDMLDSVSSKSDSRGDFKDMFSNVNFDENFNKTIQNDNFDFSNLDFETMTKIKNIMSKLSSNQHSPRVNLLNSLKPYLKSSRKDKLDQYIQFLNMASIFESLNNSGVDK